MALRIREFALMRAPERGARRVPIGSTGGGSSSSVTHGAEHERHIISAAHQTPRQRRSIRLRAPLHRAQCALLNAHHLKETAHGLRHTQ
jgi:hypothetical protein